MANVRLKKTESTNRQKDVPEETSLSAKNESFLDNSSEDELTRKRKMILTGITAGVGVAGATAAGLLFLGPYSPFGVNSSEKSDKPAEERSLPEEKTKVQVQQPVATKQTAAIVAPQPEHKKEEQKVPNPVSEVTPVRPMEKPVVKKEKPVVVSPSPKAVVNSFGPSSYNYDIQDGGPVVEVPSRKRITVSRDPGFRKIYLNGNSNFSGKYRISIPPPGDIYWKEEGKSAHKITINPPSSSGIQADFPAQVKMSDTLNWSASGKVSFYRIEIASDADFQNRVKVFSTNKTSFPVENIGQGKWFIRISSLNLQSGTWDSTKIFPINIGEIPAPMVAAPPEQIQELPKEEMQEAPKDILKETPTSKNIEDSGSKLVEPVSPVEATVPEMKLVPEQTGE